jgi:hypothetical protein
MTSLIDRVKRIEKMKLQLDVLIPSMSKDVDWLLFQVERLEKENEKVKDKFELAIFHLANASLSFQDKHVDHICPPTSVSDNCNQNENAEIDICVQCWTEWFTEPSK